MIILVCCQKQTKMIIGIMGAVGSGKDTCGDYLASTHEFRKVAFAKRVKDVAHAAFGWDRELLEGATAESRAWRERVDPVWGFSPRHALQKIGTEMFRAHLDADIWVKAVRNELTASPEQNFVITDVRFENEVDMIKALGGHIVYVERGRQPDWTAEARAGRPYDESCGVHVTDWNSYALTCRADICIFNNGELRDLYTRLDSLVQLL